MATTTVRPTTARPPTTPPAMAPAGADEPPPPPVAGRASPVEVVVDDVALEAAVPKESVAPLVVESEVGMGVEVGDAATDGLDDGVVEESTPESSKWPTPAEAWQSSWV